MAEMSDRQELERRLEQVRRILRSASFDPLTTERFQKLVRDIEEQLKEPE
jgi:flagellar basal body-associated protein FliL